jgi:DNA-binding transcriptional regulator YiaG
LERYGARIIKQSSISCSPAKKTNKRREIKAMRLRLQAERKEFASKIATRLMGRWI